MQDNDTSEVVIGQGVEQFTIEAVITRADGRIENLGTISYWHRNPLKRIVWFVYRRLRDLAKRTLKF